MRNFVFIAPTTLSAAHAGQACNPPPNADQLFARLDLRYIILGEMHGTNETPALFYDLVCGAAATFAERAIVVGVERNVSEQELIDAFMDKRNHRAARAALLASPGWNSSDGRSSRAVLQLLETCGCWA